MKIADIDNRSAYATRLLSMIHSKRFERSEMEHIALCSNTPQTWNSSPRSMKFSRKTVLSHPFENPYSIA
jgi:hypothetical protein